MAKGRHTWQEHGKSQCRAPDWLRAMKAGWGAPRVGRGLTVKAGLAGHASASPQARPGAAVPAGRPVGPLERGDRRPSTQTWDEPPWGGVVPSAEKQLPPRALPVSHQPSVMPFTVPLTEEEVSCW